MKVVVIGGNQVVVDSLKFEVKIYMLYLVEWYCFNDCILIYNICWDKWEEVVWS